MLFCGRSNEPVWRSYDNTLAASVLVAFAAAPVAAGNPPISVKLSEKEYLAGDHARVHVKAAEGGSLVVLRLDADRHISVLVPLNPGDDAMVKGGHEIEIRGRGDRDRTGTPTKAMRPRTGTVGMC